MSTVSAARFSMLSALTVAQREIIEMLLKDEEPALESELADVRTIQELLGHKDVRATMIYTHAEPWRPWRAQSA